MSAGWGAREGECEGRLIRGCFVLIFGWLVF